MGDAPAVAEMDEDRDGKAGETEKHDWREESHGRSSKHQASTSKQI
jgi:hypothetical protein